MLKKLYQKLFSPKIVPGYVQDQLENHFRIRDTETSIDNLRKEIILPLRDTIFSYKEGTKYDQGYQLWLDHISPTENPNKHYEYILYTDNLLKEAIKDKSAKNKLFWLIESPLVFSGFFNKMFKFRYYHHFKKVLTHSEEHLKLGPPFVFQPVCLTFIYNPLDWAIPTHKTQMVSIFASEKNSLPGQKLRHQVISKYRNKLDAILGRAYKLLDNKADGLIPFRYSIAIENCRANFYFTEKLIDCFLTGTIPIYWGCPSIGRFFDTRGMIIFQEINELESILNNLSDKDYQEKMPYIEKNFKTAQQYTKSGKYIYEHVREFFPNSSTL